jgi:chromosome transmission fidelity protein 18
MIGVQSNVPKKKRKGDKFRLLRPLILICNDVYHPALRPLRQSSIAEIVHIRKPPLNMVISRMHSIFQKEGIPCDSDGVRRLCEATWGVSTKKEGGTGTGTGEGDIRGVMVVGEWVAGKLRSTLNAEPGITRLTRRWIEDNILNDLSHGGGAARSLGRGGAKEVAERVFREGAGFPKSAVTVEQNKGYLDGTGVIGVAEASKRRAIERLREMIDTSGETDKITTGKNLRLLALVDHYAKDHRLLHKLSKSALARRHLSQ